MNKNNIKAILALILILLLIPILSSAAVENYLIIEDIDSYNFITQTINPLTKKTIITQGYTIRNAPGFLAGANHFDLDHDDMTYETDYESDVADLGVEVQVTEHAGSDSDKWLLHEVDMEFRNYYGIPGRSYSRRQIDGQTVMEIIAGGRDYRWISGNKVIMIEYHDSQLIKPEPIEVVKAYLAKHTSTLMPMGLVELRSDAKVTTWIKDEMDRRLWLCDKWVEQQQAGTVDVDKLVREMHNHMKVFLNYKKKYYGIDTDNEKNAIYEYMQAKDEAAMKNKLAEYKAWWTANKDGAINL